MSELEEDMHKEVDNYVNMKHVGSKFDAGTGFLAGVKWAREYLKSAFDEVKADFDKSHEYMKNEQAKTFKWGDKNLKKRYKLEAKLAIAREGLEKIEAPDLHFLNMVDMTKLARRTLAKLSDE